MKAQRKVEFRKHTPCGVTLDGFEVFGIALRGHRDRQITDAEARAIEVVAATATGKGYHYGPFQTDMGDHEIEVDGRCYEAYNATPLPEPVKRAFASALSGVIAWMRAERVSVNMVESWGRSYVRRLLRATKRIEANEGRMVRL